MPTQKPWTWLLLCVAAGCGGPSGPSPAPATRIAPNEASPAVDPPADPPESQAASGSVSRPIPLELEDDSEFVAARGSREIVLRSFGSASALRAHAGRFVSKLRRMYARRGRRARRMAHGEVGLGSAPLADSTEADSASNGAPAEESVTNTQVAGVDEGGIVKTWRDYLVILRRGRLFSARLGAEPGAAAPISALDVRPPGAHHDAWYDEMLVHAPSGRIVAIGFSYEHGATEVGLFQIATDGTLSHRETHLLRSNDYYSSRNYASRLVGDTLVFYMPHYLVGFRESDGVPRVSLPGVRSFAAGTRAFRSIIDGRKIYRIGGDRDGSTLHTVVTCDLSSPRFTCTAHGIVGDEGRTFYVSRDAVYVWVTPGWNDWNDEEEDIDERPSHLFRLPLDGARPSAIVVRGAPVDQFSFHETDSALFVVTRGEGGGDAMWAPEFTRGSVALARVDFASGPGGRTLRPAHYRVLQRPRSNRHRHQAMQNRFVGRYLIYGMGTTWGTPGQGGVRAFLHDYQEGRSFAADLEHSVDRIEAMGGAAVIVGTEGSNLHFQALGLGPVPSGAGHHVIANASQGETRSHGFFYRRLTENSGLLGLPTRGPGSAGAGQLTQGAANVQFLRVQSLEFSGLGALSNHAQTQDDQCEVSCVDWYGNARPLFLRNRVFALMGYELVEGQIQGDRLTEIGRMTFLSALTPQAVASGTMN